MKTMVRPDEKSISLPLRYPEVIPIVSRSVEGVQNKFQFRRGIDTLFQSDQNSTSVTSNLEATVPNLKTFQEEIQEDNLSNIFLYSPSQIKQENQSNIGASCKTGLQTFNDTNQLIIDEQLNTPDIEIRRASQFFNPLKIENQSNHNKHLNDQLELISINNVYGQYIDIQNLNNLNKLTSNKSNKLTSDLFDYQNSPEMESDSAMYTIFNTNSYVEDDFQIFDTDEKMAQIYENYSNHMDINDILKENNNNSHSNDFIIDLDNPDILYKDVMITSPLLGEENNIEFNNTNVYGHHIIDNCINIEELHYEKNSFDNNDENLNLNENATTSSLIGSYTTSNNLPIDTTINSVNISEQNVSGIINININNKVEEYNEQKELKTHKLHIQIPDITECTETEVNTADVLEIIDEQFDLISFIANDKKDLLHQKTPEEQNNSFMKNKEESFVFSLDNIKLTGKLQSETEDTLVSLSPTSVFSSPTTPSTSILSSPSSPSTSAERSTSVTPRRRGRPPILEDSLPSPAQYQHLSEKDAKYVEMRNKNNLASRRSRMNRKHRELNREDESKLLEATNRALIKQAKKLERLVKKWEKNVLELASL